MKMITVKEVSELCEHVLLNDSICPDDFRDPHMRFTSQDGHGSLGVVLRG